MLEKSDRPWGRFEVLQESPTHKVKCIWVLRIEMSPTDVIFIEVQTGTYFGEDDIERLEDDFGRANLL